MNTIRYFYHLANGFAYVYTQQHHSEIEMNVHCFCQFCNFDSDSYLRELLFCFINDHFSRNICTTLIGVFSLYHFNNLEQEINEGNDTT